MLRQEHDKVAPADVFFASKELLSTNGNGPIDGRSKSPGDTRSDTATNSDYSTVPSWSTPYSLSFLKPSSQTLSGAAHPSKADNSRLHVTDLIKRTQRSVISVAGLLDATHRNCHVSASIAVHMDDAGLHLVHHSMRARKV